MRHVPLAEDPASAHLVANLALTARHFKVKMS